jgi:hypothetical protein
MLFIFDENFPRGFVEGFAKIEKSDKRNPILSTVVYSCDFMESAPGESVRDEAIIEKAAQSDAVIVTMDSDFKKVKHYKPLLAEHRVGYIFFRQTGSNHYWDIVKAFINSWADLKLKISNSTHPFAFEVNKKGQIVNLPF